MYGFVIPDNAKRHIIRLISGEASDLNISRIMVGSGVYEGDNTSIKSISDLVNPIAEASSSKPVVDADGKLSFTVIYSNDMNGGLKENFLLAEFGVFAKIDEEAEFLLYYGTLGELDRQPVRKFEGNTVDIRKFPVEIQISTDVNITVSYDCSNYTTTDDFENFKTEINDIINGFNQVGISYVDEDETLVITCSAEGGGTSGGYTLPVATEDTLGGVMIGNGINIDTEGHITPDTDSISEDIENNMEEFTDEEIKSIFKEEENL